MISKKNNYKNIEIAIRKFCEENNIPDFDHIFILNSVVKEIGIYFNKHVYLSIDGFLRFLETDRKITISSELVKNVKKSLTSILKEYKNSSFNSSNQQKREKITKKIFRAKVIQNKEHSFILAFNNSYAYLLKKNIKKPLEIGEDYYIYINKYNSQNDIFEAFIDNRVANFLLESIFQDENKNYKTIFYQHCGILSLTYDGNKPKKEDIEKIKLFIACEKVIYNQAKRKEVA